MIRNKGSGAIIHIRTPKHCGFKHGKGLCLLRPGHKEAKSKDTKDHRIGYHQCAWCISGQHLECVGGSRMYPCDCPVCHGRN